MIMSIIFILCAELGCIGVYIMNLNFRIVLDIKVNHSVIPPRFHKIKSLETVDISMETIECF